jgi:hypothetical protein
MKQFLGLENLVTLNHGFLSSHDFARRIVDDLEDCRCLIFGCIGDDDKILLAELSLIADSLYYDMFDQRIDFVVSGTIARNDCVPLTYCLQGGEFAISGRCSMIPRVCGVDLYLQASYTGVIGDIARQKFSIAIKPLFKMLKPR